MEQSTEREIRFLADAMLGRLARWLRILGYDTVYMRNPTTAEQLIEAAANWKRVCLSRNSRLNRDDFPNGFLFITHDRWRDQLREVFTALDLQVNFDRIFTRCAVCNGELEEIAKEEVLGLAPEYVLRNSQGFYQCRTCHRLYWAGSHRHRLERLIKEKLNLKSIW